MIKIKPIVKKQPLKYGKQVMVKGKILEVPIYSIQIYINDRAHVYYISSGITTTNRNMVGFAFTDKYESAITNARKTTQLTEIIDECNNYVLTHRGESVMQRKAALKQIISGKDTSANVSLVELIRDYAANCNGSTERLYKQTADKVAEFGEPEILDTKWLDKFSAYCLKTNKVNTVAKHLRQIKTSIRYARRNGAQIDNPFEDYKIRSELKVDNLRLSAEDVRTLRDYPVEPWQEKYRDAALLSFYLGGMDIGDMLLTEHLTHGRWITVRQKTKNKNIIDVPVVPEAAAIIEKYKGKHHVLIWAEEVKDYRTFNKRMNHALKTIGTFELVPDKVGRLRKREYHPLFDGITSKTMRRSFATIADSLGIHVNVIAQAMAHSWSSIACGVVTEVYIRRSQKVIDECIERVVKHISL